MDYIKKNTRPNLYKFTEKELFDIILKYDQDFLENSNKQISRNELIDKVFDLWSNNQICDCDSNPIECLICYESLTNGNNLTFECGHKFHSICIVKHVLILTTTTYKNYLSNENQEKKSNKINYCCPQCKKLIDNVELDIL